MFSFKFPENNDEPSVPIAIVEGGHANHQILWLYPSRFRGEGMFDIIKLKDGKFVPMPNSQPRQRSNLVVVGSSGIGKSTFINEWINSFNKIFPDHDENVLFTTNEEDDPALKEQEMKKIIVDEDFVKHPLKCEDIAGEHPKIIVFDDYRMGIQKVRDSVDKTRNDIGERGRKMDLHLVVSSTSAPIREALYRELLANCTEFVYFKDRPPSNLKRILENYFDVSDKLRADLRKWDSRWILLSRASAPFIIGEDCALIFNPEREAERLKGASIKPTVKIYKREETEERKYLDEYYDRIRKQEAKEVEAISEKRRKKAQIDPLSLGHVPLRNVEKRVKFGTIDPDVFDNDVDYIIAKELFDLNQSKAKLESIPKHLRTPTQEKMLEYTVNSLEEHNRIQAAHKRIKEEKASIEKRLYTELRRKVRNAENILTIGEEDYENAVAQYPEIEEQLLSPLRKSERDLLFDRLKNVYAKIRRYEIGRELHGNIVETDDPQYTKDLQLKAVKLGLLSEKKRKEVDRKVKRGIDEHTLLRKELAREMLKREARTDDFSEEELERFNNMISGKMYQDNDGTLRKRMLQPETAMRKIRELRAAQIEADIPSGTEDELGLPEPEEETGSEGSESESDE